MTLKELQQKEIMLNLKLKLETSAMHFQNKYTLGYKKYELVGEVKPKAKGLLQFKVEAV